MLTIAVDKISVKLFYQFFFFLYFVLRLHFKSLFQAFLFDPSDSYHVIISLHEWLQCKQSIYDKKKKKIQSLKKKEKTGYSHTLIIIFFFFFGGKIIKIFGVFWILHIHKMHFLACKISPSNFHKTAVTSTAVLGTHMHRSVCFSGNASAEEDRVVKVTGS